MKSLQNWQECNVVRLSTKNNSAPIDYNHIDNRLSFGELPQFTKYNPQHLYITNPNEPIKEGDWYIYVDILNKLHIKQYLDRGIRRGNDGEKIIATTDESLGNYITYCEDARTGKMSKDFINLPRPSNEFLKKYCKLGGIDEIMIEYEEEYHCFAETQRDRCFRGSCNCSKKLALKVDLYGLSLLITVTILI